MLLMLPNVGWMLSPESDGGQQGSAPLALTIAENLGRAAVLGLPFFYSLDLRRKYSTVVVGGMGLALAVYYAAWSRYFVGGGTAESPEGTITWYSVAAGGCSCRSAGSFVIRDEFMVDVRRGVVLWCSTCRGVGDDSLSSSCVAS